MIEVKIKGMNCSHCCASATKALLSLPNVTDAKVELTTGKALIYGETSFEAVKEAMDSLGFTAEKL